MGHGSNKSGIPVRRSCLDIRIRCIVTFNTLSSNLTWCKTAVRSAAFKCAAVDIISWMVTTPLPSPSCMPRGATEVFWDRARECGVGWKMFNRCDQRVANVPYGNWSDVSLYEAV